MSKRELKNKMLALIQKKYTIVAESQVLTKNGRIISRRSAKFSAQWKRLLFDQKPPKFEDQKKMAFDRAQKYFARITHTGFLEKWN